MIESVSATYDVAIVGAGPVGSFCALAHARKGARVALLEANPKASSRLAGEWLHPPAVRMLRDLGIQLDASPQSSPGIGFVVFPEDRSEPIELPYARDTTGMACEHAALVSKLHNALEDCTEVDRYEGARVRSVENGRVTFSLDGEQKSLATDRLIGADGRASVVRKSLGLPKERMTCSRMIGVVLEGIDLPYEGYGHVIIGGPGPILMFRLGTNKVRIIVDVPLDHWTPRDRVSMLVESYANLLPESICEPFASALRDGVFQAAGNELLPRATYGNSRRVLIGDAAGHYHPLTAVGITLGFSDALDIAEAQDFRKFTAKRLDSVRAPERLAFGLYEVFADHRPESVAVRQATYRRWRKSPKIRKHTMNLLACENVSITRLGLTFFSIMARAIASCYPRSFKSKEWRRARDVTGALVSRVGHFLGGFQSFRATDSATVKKTERVWNRLSRSLLVSVQSDEIKPQAAKAVQGAEPDSREALQRAIEQLLSLQHKDGSWEGEMLWCPMLTAQYVLLSYVLNQPLEPRRRRLVLKQFERTRLKDGTWGLHEHSHPYLFVTALVYVAARLLNVKKDDPLVAEAGRFLQTEDVTGIPSWGKFWLAILNLYDWNGLNAVLPELWILPHRIPLHPSNWYCHTRLIYLAMAVVYSSRFQVPVTPVIAELRDELYQNRFDAIKFRSSRNKLRVEEVFSPPTNRLRICYALGRAYELFHIKRLRKKCVTELVERVRWELNCSDHTSISPVSGFLNILALWLQDSDDVDCQRALNQIEGWIWEDEKDGTRITGARSASWDTGFALQALANTTEANEVTNSIDRAAEFLVSQQIRESFNGFETAFRNDPKGGWCFAGIWHGWPVTDCTAEAILGVLATRPNAIDSTAVREAIDFMLSGQNTDGGFGSYEARRTRSNLEWLNPAEMFGESMTENSYVECTASCLEAIASIRTHFPSIVDGALDRSVSRGDAWLRQTQESDGSWRGVWGVQYIYGTLFGIRGLKAAGASPGDAALRLACKWLLEKQREDGGWGEHHSGCWKGRFVPHDESQVIQTAWALIGLLEAGESNWIAISRGAKFLADSQLEDGSWERQDMVGVFFRTALLDYALYRQYFPLQALSLYEQRRQVRKVPNLTAARP